MKNFKTISSLLLFSWLGLIFVLNKTALQYKTLKLTEKPPVNQSIIFKNKPKSSSININPTIIPTPTLTNYLKPQIEKQDDKNNETSENEQNYQMKPCDDSSEGCFTIKSIIPETMSTVDQLNSAVNNYRKSHNLNQLFIDPQICDISSKRANEIQNDFSHQKFRDHVQNGDYNYIGFQTIGENLFQGIFSAVHIVEFGWDRSEGHRKNLQGNWSRGCAGIFENNATFVFVN